MTFANIITKAKNIVGKVFVQHPNVLVSISDLLIERFISSFCFADGFIIRNSGDNILIDLLEHKQVLSEFLISDQANIAVHLFDCRLIIFCEVTRDTYNSRHAPINVICRFQTQLFNYKHFETIFVIQKPVQIKETLVNHILLHRPLVFKDDRAMVFVNANAVHASTIRCAILRGKKCYTEKDVHIIFNHCLKFFFKCDSAALIFLYCALYVKSFVSAIVSPIPFAIRKLHHISDIDI